MHRDFNLLWIRNYMLLFYKPSLRFIFLAFVQPRSFRGDFYFSWRSIMSYSDSWSGGNVCRLFAQMYAALRIFTALCTFVYGFCVHIRLLHTFVYGFCARCAAFAYVYGLYFAHVVRLLRTYTAYLHAFQSGQSQGIPYCRFLDLFFPCEGSWFVDSLEDPILRVPSISLSTRAACYYWTLSRIQYWGKDFFVRTSCSWFTVRSYIRGFLLVLIEQYILPVE